MKTLSQFIAESTGDVHDSLTKMGMTKSDLGYNPKAGTKRHQIEGTLQKHGYRVVTHNMNTGSPLGHRNIWSKEGAYSRDTFTIHEKDGGVHFLGRSGGGSHH